MANIENGSTNMSLSPTTDSAIGRIDGERYEDIKTSLQLEEISTGSIGNKRKQKAASDSVLGTKFEGPSKKSKGTSFIGHKENISEGIYLICQNHLCKLEIYLFSTCESYNWITVSYKVMLWLNCSFNPLTFIKLWFWSSKKKNYKTIS